MFNALIVMALAVTPSVAVDPPKANAGKELTLLAGDDAYKAQPGKEDTFEGWLEFNTGTGRIGLPSRNYVYRLLTIDDGKLTPRMIYLHGMEPFLAMAVGKEVRLVGKLVTTDVDGAKVTELWPARASTQAIPGEGRQLKVLARSAESAVMSSEFLRKVQPQAVVLRDAQALAKARNMSATANMTWEQLGNAAFQQIQASLGNVPGIDWSKQMLIVVASGTRSRGPIEVYRLSLNENHLEVFWRPRTGGNVGLPGRGELSVQSPVETVLVPRFDGPIWVMQEGAANNAIVLPAAGQDDAKPAETKPK